MFSDLSLDPRLVKALEKLGFDDPTPVQAETIPHALAKKDLIVSAETGSGKTAAFLLPTLHHLLADQAPGSSTRALVLVPTRELARQVMKHGEKLTAHTNIGIGVITGGDDFKYQKSLFRKNPEILVATPGRLLEHIDKSNCDLNDIEVLVLDEADRMLDMGFSEDVLKIVYNCQKERQTLLFSATLEGRGIKDMIRQVLKDPEVVSLNKKREQHSNIKHQGILVDDVKHKENVLVALLAESANKKAIVFTNTRDQADRLGGVLRYKKVKAAVLHGEKDQSQRNQVIEQFRSGGVEVLVASDVAARGLDIKNVDLVVNFDMARNGDDYIHRSGRTGRAGQEGLSVVFIKDNEWNLKASVERYLNIRFEPREIEGLVANYKGPKNIKKSGKAAGAKKKKTDKKTEKGKAKKREKAKKSSGKQRRPSGKGESDATQKPKNDGSGPIFKKKS